VVRGAWGEEEEEKEGGTAVRAPSTRHRKLRLPQLLGRNLPDIRMRLRLLDIGMRLLDIGMRLLDIGMRLLDIGMRLLDIGMRLRDIGMGLLDIGMRLLDIGMRLLDIGMRLLDIGMRLLDIGMRLLDIGMGLLDIRMRLRDDVVRVPNRCSFSFALAGGATLSLSSSHHTRRTLYVFAPPHLVIIARRSIA